MRDVFQMVCEYRENGDPKLLEEIIKAITVDVTLFIVGSVPEADRLDVRQIILLEIVKGLGSFKGEHRGTFFSWCYVIARAVVAKYHRKRKREPQTHPDYEAFLELIDRNAEREHLSQEDRRDAREGVELLKKADPECFELLFKRHVLESASAFFSSSSA